jgi:hypothetical protein
VRSPFVEWIDTIEKRHHARKIGRIAPVVIELVCRSVHDRAFAEQDTAPSAKRLSCVVASAATADGGVDRTVAGRSANRETRRGKRETAAAFSCEPECGDAEERGGRD